MFSDLPNPFEDNSAILNCKFQCSLFLLTSYVIFILFSVPPPHFSVLCKAFLTSSTLTRTLYSCSQESVREGTQGGRGGRGRDRNGIQERNCGDRSASGCTRTDLMIYSFIRVLEGRFQRSLLYHHFIFKICYACKHKH